MSKEQFRLSGEKYKTLAETALSLERSYKEEKVKFETAMERMNAELKAAKADHSRETDSLKEEYEQKLECMKNERDEFKKQSEKAEEHKKIYREEQEASNEGKERMREELKALREEYSKLESLLRKRGPVRDQKLSEVLIRFLLTDSPSLSQPNPTSGPKVRLKIDFLTICRKIGSHDKGAK